MRKGFTLLELLVVLVIISLVAAFVGPRVAGSMSTLSLKTASKKIAASLRYARSQATSENTPYIVVFDLNKNRLALGAAQATSRGDSEEEAADEGQEGYRSRIYDLPEGIIFDRVVSVESESGSEIFRIIFFPNGASSGGKVFLKNDRGRRCFVSVDFVTGTVQLGEEDAKGSKHAYSI